MAIGKIRALIIIALFVGSASVPVLMETSVVPMLNLLNFVNQFVTISTDEEGNPTSLEVNFEVLLDKLERIECVTGESDENQTVLQITLKVENTDPFEFDMLIPGIDMTIYWKAGLPYELEKERILGWRDASLNSSNPHLEPEYPMRRWTRVLGVKINPLRVTAGDEKSLQIKIYLYNDEWVRGKSSALGQMIGTILRTQSTKDPYTGETLMHLSGSASLDIPGVNFGLSLDLGLDLSGFLNITELLGGMGTSSGGGAGSEIEANLFDLLFDVPLNILDIQNYNDSNQNFARDYSGIDNKTHMKQWTENLYQNGAISAWILMDLKDQLGMKNLNITLLKSSHNPDDSEASRVWEPEVGGSPLDKSLTANQLFLYLPDSVFLENQEWRNRIFGVMGFASEQHIFDYPETLGDLGNGRIITGGTLRLTGDLREKANFTIGDSLGALMTQAIGGMLPIGIFGSIDLQLNEMPLSLALDLPLEVNLTSLLSTIMGGEETEEGGGDLFSMLLDYVGLKSFLLNGIAFDTFNSLLQLNFTTDLDMFMPYGIYMPSEAKYDPVSGTYNPYIGIGGGPLQIFDAAYPADWVNWTAQERQGWYDDHLVMNITNLDSKVFQESMAKLMATIGSSGYYNPETGDGGLGDGIAYIFNDDTESNGNYGNLLQFLTDNNALPNVEDQKSSFTFTDDQFFLDLKSFVPDFGNGLFTLADQIGIDPLFIEYLNNSIQDYSDRYNVSKTIFEDLLSIKQLLNILSQEGSENDIIDYLVDARVTYNETAVALDANTLRVAHDGVQRAISITNGSSGYSWNVSRAMPLPNGKIFLNNSLTPVGDSFKDTTSPIIVEYEANKLDLFNLSRLFGSILNLLFGTEEGGGSSEAMSSFFTDIFSYLPGILDALGIDFDKIMPDLVKYLRLNLSQPLDLENHQYGIKPFEMIDLAYHALFSSDTGTSAVITTDTRDLIDNIIKELVGKFIEQADPFQLLHATLNDLTPLMDYLNRSRIFSREVIIPLVASLFPSGGELATLEEEPVTLDSIIDIIMPFITEMIIGGEDAHFPHEALNPFALLTAPEAIIPQLAEDYNDLTSRGFSIYQVGTGNWTPDYPKYDYLRLMSNLTLGLLMSGFTAADLWAIINQLGLIDLSGEGSGGDPFAGLKGLLSLIGIFVPSTEWDSLLKELGIWSTWEGTFDEFLFNGWVWNLHIINNMDARQFIGDLINLENLLATGQLMGSEFVQLCLYENQSYGNPYAYMAGYDTSANTGPYRDIIYHTATTDNWGWAPLKWDPGGIPPPLGTGYGDVTGSNSSARGASYSKSFISRLISNVPVELDFDVINMAPINFEFSFSFDIYDILPIIHWNIPIRVAIDMDFSPQLFGRIRLEGNPSQLMGLFEEQGIPLMGLGAHFVGGDLASMVTGMIDSLTNPSTTSNETFEFPELDILSLIQAFLNSKVDILHYWKYIVDPDFMKASEWYIDPGYINMNATMPTLIWDKSPLIPGDGDGIPDEYPWYRFSIPMYNQDPTWVDAGPGSLAGRDPPLIDYLAPDGPPGSGRWIEIPDGDGVPDGIQHYWYDTPYAYVNVSVRRTDPWVNINPYMWNDVNSTAGSNGWYRYTVPGYGTIIWGDDPNEQVPLLQVAPGIGISGTAWDSTGIPSLYYVNATDASRHMYGIVGSATHYPIPQPNGQNIYPNIWNSFNVTLNQTDYRFGYWDTEYDPVLQKNVHFLETQPFYDLLSYAFYPQLMDLLDWIAPLITDLVMDMMFPSGAAGDYKGEFGYDYYHLLQNSSVYSQFGFDALQALCPLGMLEWIWEGAGERWNGTQMVPNIEPFTVPDLQGALDWMGGHGFTSEFLIKNLGNIFEMFSITPEGGGAASEAGMDLASSLASVFTVDGIVNIVNTMEEYFMKVVAVNKTTGEPDRMQATEIALRIMKDMTEILDIYPVKALRGVLNYIMPIMFAPSEEGEESSSMNVNELDLGTFLEDSGLMAIIFKNASKLSDLKLTLSIHQTKIDLYLFGQLIEDVPLDLDLNLDFATLFGGEESESGGEASPTSALSGLPISFPESGFPYIELSTFNGPFDITFNLFNTSMGGGKSPIRNTYVTIGEVWFNETSGVYIFNRTQSLYESQMGLSGWTDYDGNDYPRTYVRPNSLLQSNTSGMVRYSSVIEPDDFGWVDSYIYIHVEEPNDYPNQEFYWWNVTGHPLQRSLAGNNPPYKARWVEDGSKILVQSLNTLPKDVINIDNDNYTEIFARVEIDGYHMPVHEVVYVRVGDVWDVSIANATGGATRVQINASYTQSTQIWNIFSKIDRTSYTVEQELTPTGSTITYPTISQIISGFHLQTQGWNDDSLYSVDIDYVNLTGASLNLYSWNLNRQPGNQSAINVIYPSAPNAAFAWTPASPDRTLVLTFSPTSSAGSNYRYGNIDIRASNFLNETIKSVTVDLQLSKAPDPGTATTRRISEDFLFKKPSPPRTYFAFSNYKTGDVIIKGSPNALELKTATSAWFNFSVPLDGNSFLNGIDWNIRMQEPGNGAIANVIIQYFNTTDSKWYRLFSRTNVGKTYLPLNAGYTSPAYLDDFADLQGTLGNPHIGGPLGPNADLYLTARGRAHEVGRAFETVSRVNFSVRFTETTSFAEDGIGYTNSTPNFNTSVSVTFRFYPFVSSWGLGAIEIPDGFVNDFTATITMYDPLGRLDFRGLSTSNFTRRPVVSMNYTVYGPIQTSMYIDQEDLFARKVIVRLEAWDSLVRDRGTHGDALFKDNVTEGTKRLIPLDHLPIMNTTIEVVDLEAKVYINVTIAAGQTLRNYFLRMNITPGLGYEGQAYTSNYRFSVGTDLGGNAEAISRIGAYPSKKVLLPNALGFPVSLQVGVTDLEPFPSMFKLFYILTFEVSPEFLLNTTAQERFIFTAAWEKAAGSYEVRTDKNTLEPAKTIIITYK